jgi:DNA modification methylase
MKDSVFSSMVGDNSVLISRVAKLYLKPGDVVADTTYGKGVFWRKVDIGIFSFFPSDLLTCENKYDFRNLPYPDGKFDALIFDPPYCHNPGKMMVNDNYKNSETTKNMYHRDIINLYKEGMVEAKRVLKNPGGLLWIKCKDEIESSYQRWSHMEIYDLAKGLGFFAKDLFVLTQKVNPVVQHVKQQHSRKNHSYLWIFKLPSEKEAKELKRFKIVGPDKQLKVQAMKERLEKFATEIALLRQDMAEIES